MNSTVIFLVSSCRANCPWDSGWGVNLEDCSYLYSTSIHDIKDPWMLCDSVLRIHCVTLWDSPVHDKVNYFYFKSSLAFSIWYPRIPLTATTLVIKEYVSVVSKLTMLCLASMLQEWQIYIYFVLLFHISHHKSQCGILSDFTFFKIFFFRLIHNMWMNINVEDTLCVLRAAQTKHVAKDSCNVSDCDRDNIPDTLA